MMKRLLPVAAAVVIGLSPSFAAAASKGKVYSNRAKAYRAYKANERKADFMDAIITNGKVNAHGKGVNMAFGRVNMKFEGAIAYNYTGDNQFPMYIPSPVNNSQSSGNSLNAQFVLPLEFRINRDISANVTLSSGNDLRSTYFMDEATTNVLPHGGWAEGLAVGNIWSPRVEDAYMTYRMGNFAIFGGWMTSGLTPIDISPANPVAQFHDLMEYSGVNLGAMFSHSGFYATAALVDPGVEGGAGVLNSRATDSANSNKMDNYSVSLGYAGKSGNTRYVFGAKYLNQAVDLTYIQGMIDHTAGAAAFAVGTKPHAYGINAGVGFGKFGVSANYIVLEKDANAYSGMDMATNNAKLLDLDLSYQINRGSKVSGFYNDNSKGHADGLPRKQYGLKGSYQLAHNTDLTAAVWKEKTNTQAAAGTRAQSATRFNLTAAYYLGGK